MRLKVLDSAYIDDFIDRGYNGDFVRSVVTDYGKEFTKFFIVEKLQDWEVCFKFRYNNTKQILIYTKDRSFVNEKYKDITVHIPVPLRDQAEWGVELTQCIFKNDSHLDKTTRNFYCLDVDYLQFENRQDYIIDSMKRAIRFCFHNGFTINGIKVKI